MKRSRPLLSTLIGSLSSDPDSGFRIRNEAALRSDIEKIHRHSYPMAIRIVIILGAWLGAALFTACISLSFLGHSSSYAFYTGFIFIAAAVGYSYLNRFTIVFEAMAQAFLIIGASLIITSSKFTHEANEHSVWMILFLTETIVAGATASSAQRFSAAALAPLFGALWLLNAGMPALLLVLVGFIAALVVMLHTGETIIMAQLKPLIRALQPLRQGLSFGLLTVVFFSVSKDAFDHGNISWLFTSIVLTIAVLVLFGIIFRNRCQFSWEKTVLLLFLLTCCLGPVVYAPGISAAILVLLCGFIAGNHFSSVLGMVALVFFCIMYFYNLEISLLVKSLCMLGSGLVLLCIGIIFHRQLQRS